MVRRLGHPGGRRGRTGRQGQHQRPLGPLGLRDAAAQVPAWHEGHRVPGDAGAIDGQRLGHAHDVVAGLVEGDHLDPVHRIDALVPQVAEIPQPARGPPRPGVVARRDQRDRIAEAVAQPFQIGRAQPRVVARVPRQAREFKGFADHARHLPGGVGHHLHQPARADRGLDGVVELAFLPGNGQDQFRRQPEAAPLQPRQRVMQGGIDAALDRRRLGQPQRVPRAAQFQHQAAHAGDVLGSRAVGEMQEEALRLRGLARRDQPQPGLEQPVARQGRAAPVGQGPGRRSGHGQRGLHGGPDPLGGQLAVIGGLMRGGLFKGGARACPVAQRLGCAALPVMAPGKRDGVEARHGQPGEMRGRPVGRVRPQRGIARDPVQVDGIAVARRQEVVGGKAFGQRPVPRAQGGAGVILARPRPGRRIAQRLGRGRAFQHQLPRQVPLLGGHPPAEAIKRQPGVVPQVARQREDQRVHARTTGLHGDAGAGQVGRGAGHARQHPFGRRPFARVQQRLQARGVMRRDRCAMGGQKGRLGRGIERGPLGPEAGRGLGAPVLGLGRDPGEGTVQGFGQAIAEPGQNLGGGQVGAQKRLSAPEQKLHPRPVGVAGGKVAVIGPGPLPRAQALPQDQVGGDGPRLARRRLGRRPVLCGRGRERPADRARVLGQGGRNKAGRGQRQRGQWGDQAVHARQSGGGRPLGQLTSAAGALGNPRGRLYAARETIVRIVPCSKGPCPRSSPR